MIKSYSINFSKKKKKIPSNQSRKEYTKNETKKLFSLPTIPKFATQILNFRQTLSKTAEKDWARLKLLQMTVCMCWVINCGYKFVVSDIT